MKGFKRLTSIVVAVAMVITLCTISPSTQAEAAVTILTDKKMTIVIGKKDTIAVKQKGATFKSSNKKIATVSKKGVVKGKKAGTCKITVTVGNSSKKVTVNVKPKKVTLKSVTLSGTNSAKVRWKKVSGVTGYYVYYSTKRKSGYKRVKVKGAKKTTTTIKNLTLGNTYYFRVKAYVKSKKKTITSNTYSTVLSLKTWKLAWSDEFNGSTLDLSSWTYETGNGTGGWGNQELQYYTAGDNIKFENGNLVIVPRLEVNKTTGNIQNVTSTRIKTADKREFTYGKMEIRAKATKGQGTWSAGWMLGDDSKDSRGWPYTGEIDILESMNGGVPQTIHCPYFNNQSWSHGNKNYSTGLTQAQSAADYHTYGIIWTDTYIQFTVDGVNKGLYDPTMYSESIYDQTWVFDHPFYFILNCAVGGNAAGSVSTNGWTLVSDQNNIQTYEDYYYIDYVRVYQ